MTREETKQVLLLLHADIGKLPSDTKIKVWAEMLGVVPFSLGLAAAKEMLKRKRAFGEPQFPDYREIVNELYREARRALRPAVRRLDPAERSRLSASDAAAYDEHISKRQKISKELARAFLGNHAPQLLGGNAK